MGERRWEDAGGSPPGVDFRERLDRPGRPDAAGDAIALRAVALRGVGPIPQVGMVGGPDVARRNEGLDQLENTALERRVVIGMLHQQPRGTGCLFTSVEFRRSAGEGVPPTLCLTPAFIRTAPTRLCIRAPVGRRISDATSR
jgi:hypothetical protein